LNESLIKFHWLKSEAFNYLLIVQFDLIDVTPSWIQECITQHRAPAVHSWAELFQRLVPAKRAWSPKGHHFSKHWFRASISHAHRCLNWTQKGVDWAI